MVVGNGMIATRFMNYKNDETKIIFASGVSNSGNSREQDFSREVNLLSKTIKNYPDKTFVYFSTCSINDKDLQNSPYVLHKISIENYIKQHAENFLILRVSNVAGVSNNPYTLLNNFIFNILHNNSLLIFKNAYRNIIGIDDVHEISNKILETCIYKNEVINIANPKNYSAPFIIKQIEKHLGKKAIYTEVNRGFNYHIDITAIEPVIEQCKINFDDDYLAALLKKYYHSK